MSYISAYRDGNDVFVWERNEDGERVVKEYPAPFYFYIKNQNGKYKSIHGQLLERIDLDNFDKYYRTKQKLQESGYELFESDIAPELKVLSEYYYNKPASNLHITFYDIEVDYDPEIGFSSPDDPYAPISAITLYNVWEKQYYTISIPPKNFNGELSDELHQLSKIILVDSEKELLKTFMTLIDDSDYLSGWNSSGFDAPYISKRVEKILGTGYFRNLSFERGKMPEFKLETNKFGTEQTVVKWCGRINSDYLLLFKKFEQENRGSYSLDAIGEEFCPDLTKLKYQGSLSDLYNTNYDYFLKYNIRDVQIIEALEKKLGYVNISINFYTSSCGLFDHVYGTTKLADQYIVSYCHHELDLIVPDFREKTVQKAAGAFVLPVRSGLYDWVASIDVNSLYPSSILSINISPETLIGQFQHEEEDFNLILNNSESNVTLNYDDGRNETKSAIEWKQYLKDKKYCVSGFGTVFTQEKIGIIPNIIDNWFSKRKEYKGLKDSNYAEYKKTKDESKKEQYEYYDKLQYIFKIRLNSLYGALLNQYFRFYDYRMGSSTTATGRHILKHQTSKVIECLTGEYIPESPLCVAGDTDSVFFCIPAKNKKDAIELADSICNIVNKSFPSFMRNSFLCHKTFDNRIKSVRDVVADKCIFVKKKHYICHVLNKEGKDVDEMKIMGLEIKKTTIPKHVSKKLIEFIEFFMTSGTWDEFAKKIVDYKSELTKFENIMEIGIPSGVNKMIEYSQKYAKDGIKTKMPGHVAGAILCNQHIDLYEDKETIKIKSGMKIRRFNLKYKHKGKFNSICLPAEIYKIPEWFNELFYDKIDINSHIERIVDAPLASICEAIGKDVPNAQQLYAESIFIY